MREKTSTLKSENEDRNRVSIQIQRLMRKLPADGCPGCHSMNVVPILYGFPGSEMIQAQIDGDIELGGCGISPDMRRWKCRNCGQRFGALQLRPDHVYEHLLI